LFFVTLTRQLAIIGYKYILFESSVLILCLIYIFDGFRGLYFIVPCLLYLLIILLFIIVFGCFIYNNPNEGGSRGERLGK